MSSDAPSEGTPVAEHGHLTVERTMMLDEHGKPVQLRGISSMSLHNESTGYAYNEDGLRWLRDNWKMQLIRAATPIDSPVAVLSSKAVIAKSMQKLEVIIRLAVKLGIYVLVDLHSYHANEHEAEAVAFFADIAEKYGHLPNVIYEPFHEPLKVSWSDVLKPYHQKVVKTIRDRGSKNIVVQGTPSWSQSVDEAALDPLAEPNVMYTRDVVGNAAGEV